MAEKMVTVKVAKLQVLAADAATADEAVRHLNAAVYLRPNSVNLLVARSEALLRLGDTASALANIRHALVLAEAAVARGVGPAPTEADGNDVWARAELQSRLAGLLDLRAAALMMSGEPEAALPCLTEAIELVPDQPSYLMHRALAYTGCDEPILALRDLEVRSTHLRRSGTDAPFISSANRHAPPLPGVLRARRRRARRRGIHRRLALLARQAAAASRGALQRARRRRPGMYTHVYLYIYMYCVAICISGSSSSSISIYLSIYLSISIYQYRYIYIYRYFYLSIYPSLSICI